MSHRTHEATGLVSSAVAKRPVINGAISDLYDKLRANGAQSKWRREGATCIVTTAGRMLSSKRVVVRASVSEERVGIGKSGLEMLLLRSPLPRKAEACTTLRKANLRPNCWRTYSKTRVVYSETLVLPRTCGGEQSHLRHATRQGNTLQPRLWACWNGTSSLERCQRQVLHQGATLVQCHLHALLANSFASTDTRQITRAFSSLQVVDKFA